MDDDGKERRAWLNGFDQRRSWIASLSSSLRTPRLRTSPRFAYIAILLLIIILGLREYQHCDHYSYESNVVDSNLKLEKIIDSSSKADNVSASLPLLHDAKATACEREDDLTNPQNVAYVSMFSETLMTAQNVTYSYEDDHYYIAMRMLTYQLLYAPDTRTRRSIPFIIMVTADVSHEKRDQLRRDGAIIWEPEPITNGLEWMKTEMYQIEWADQLSKLRVFEMVQYDRILYLDGDTVLMRCMDGIFDENVFNNTEVATRTDPAQIKEDEGPMPKKYLVSSQFETLDRPYSYPPTPDQCTAEDPTNLLNGGFILLKPDLELSQHYQSVAAIPYRFNAWWMEQGLLWYVHRQDGNMPSLTLPATWNTISANSDAVAGRVASIHDKWWKPRSLITAKQYSQVQKYFLAVRWRMEAFYDLRHNYLQSTFKNQEELLGVDLTVSV
ncbi:hypothetical protein ANO11243_063440 [Dothideomycetidae sp. 11243]|nr:hypothetical protein ANO11243_063440 [fungal sp. No.11243]